MLNDTNIHIYVIVFFLVFNYCRFCNVTLVAIKIHMMVRSYVVLTWTRGKIDSV